MYSSSQMFWQITAHWHLKLTLLVRLLLYKTNPNRGGQEGTINLKAESCKVTKNGKGAWVETCPKVSPGVAPRVGEPTCYCHMPPLIGKYQKWDKSDGDNIMFSLTCNSDPYSKWYFGTRQIMHYLELQRVRSANLDVAKLGTYLYL